MTLSQKDIDLFYKLHTELLQYINVRLKLLPKIKTAKKLKNAGMENVALVRNELWKRLDFIDEFISENPAKLSPEEILIVASWKKAIQGKFFMAKHLKKYSIFLTADHQSMKAYGVKSLMRPLDEMFFGTPIYLEAVLIPFKNDIIYDAILYPYNMTFGAGFRRNLNEDYQKSKKRFGIIEKLNS